MMHLPTKWNQLVANVTNAEQAVSDAYQTMHKNPTGMTVSEHERAQLDHQAAVIELVLFAKTHGYEIVEAMRG